MSVLCRRGSGSLGWCAFRLKLWKVQNNCLLCPSCWSVISLCHSMLIKTVRVKHCSQKLSSPFYRQGNWGSGKGYKWQSRFSDDPANVVNLISGSSTFSKSSFNIWKFSVHILLKPGLENFEYYLSSLWDEYNCVVVWTFFDIAFLWDWNENWPFPVLWPLLSFPNLLAYWVHHFHNIIFQDLK